MSAIEQIKKLEEQKQQLIDQAKEEALDQANAAITILKELGFNYSLVGDKTTTRRSGIRATVLAEIKKKPGISRAELFGALNAANTKEKQSIDNARAALAKSGKITAEDGIYTAV